MADLCTTCDGTRVVMRLGGRLIRAPHANAVRALATMRAGPRLEILRRAGNIRADGESTEVLLGLVARVVQLIRYTESAAPCPDCRPGLVVQLGPPVPDDPRPSPSP